MGRARPPAVVLTGVAIIVAFVLVTGVTAALTVPAVALSAQVSLAQMLPRTTVAYVAVDLNPTGTARGDLTAIGRAFSRQRGWDRISDLFSPQTSPRRHGSCLGDTVSAAGDRLAYLGHESALAVLPGGPNRTGHKRRTVDRVVANNLVLVAPLDVRMTLVDAVSGFSFSVPKQATRYRQVRVYREVVPMCDRRGGVVPSSYYVAIQKGYVVVALSQRPIERVIDASLSRAGSLAQSQEYRRLTSQLPSTGIAEYYIDGPALGGRHGFLARLRSVLPIPAMVLGKVRHAGTIAGVATEQPSQLQLTSARLLTSHDRLPRADPGELLRALPKGTPFFLASRSMQGELAQSVQSHLLPLRIKPRELRLLTRSVYGEVDVFEPTRRSSVAQSPSDSSRDTPISLLWDIRSGDPRTIRIVRLAAEEIAGRKELTSGLDGTIRYGVDAQGGGYAVGSHWALISSDVFRGIDLMQTSPSSAPPAINQLPRPGAVSTSPLSLMWELHVRTARTLISTAVRRLVGEKGRPLFPDLPVVLAPVSTISGSVQDMPKAHVSLTYLTVTIPTAVQPAGTGY
ncbi:MAG TPA: DUF3352 domain-containing protein [Chloroflexota bacterium]|nr:DUF3352 domain-containing protein [Chloroflexota bacterium]